MSDQSVSIVAEQLRMVMKSRLPIYSGSLLAIVAAVFLQDQLPPLLLDLWAAAMLGWQAIRYAIWRRFRAAASDEAVARQAWLVTLQWSVTGLLWGLFGAAYSLPANPEASFFMLFIVTTTVAGGLIAASSYLPAHAGYIIGAGIPTTLAFAWHGSRFSLLMAGMGIVVVATGWLTAFFSNRGVVEMITLQVEDAAGRQSARGEGSGRSRELTSSLASSPI